MVEVVPALIMLMASSRFGIEMVPVDQEDQSQEEEDDIPLLEGFHWDLLMDSAASATPRKRSLSESSLPPGSAHSGFPSLTSSDATQRGPSLPHGRRQGSSVCEAVEEKQAGKAGAELQRSESLVVDSESGSEQPDGQGTGKRRRAVRVSDGNSSHNMSPPMDLRPSIIQT